jgi:hypothetical protein
MKVEDVLGGVLSAEITIHGITSGQLAIGQLGNAAKPKQQQNSRVLADLKHISLICAK